VLNSFLKIAKLILMRELEKLRVICCEPAQAWLREQVRAAARSIRGKLRAG